MAEIDVQAEKTESGYSCRVTVTEGRGKTEHSVTVKENDYTRLTQGEISPEVLVRESFRFLLERESKESILRSFDLMTIGRYFPEYER
ncbi:MAG: hypothetical protein ACP5HS_14320, partial [Anaerolineae bacterium]